MLMTSQGYVTMFHGKTKVNTALHMNIASDSRRGCRRWVLMERSSVSAWVAALIFHHTCGICSDKCKGKDLPT